MNNFNADFHANTIDGSIATVWSVTKTNHKGKECYRIVKNQGHPRSETHYIFAVTHPGGTTSWQDLEGLATEEFAQIGTSITERNDRLKR